MCGHVGQPTNYSLMNEVYETERIVSMQSEDILAIMTQWAIPALCTRGMIYDEQKYDLANSVGRFTG